MAKKSSKTKYHLSLAGEYGVCSELSKRGFDVSMTLGNAKAVDVWVLRNNGSYARIEVKTTRGKKFVTGFFQKYYNVSNPSHPDFWVLVYIDVNDVSHYYILTHQEMGNLQMVRNGMTTWAPVNGVDNVLLRDVKTFEDDWDKI